MTDTRLEELPLISLTTETAPVLEQHRFNESNLERYMCDNIEDFKPPIQIGQIRGGMSNPTFVLIDRTGRRYVLRKKPPGKLLSSAHAVDREYRVMSAFWETEVPVAKPYVLCQDPGVIGTDFYLMDFVDGRVLRGYALEDMPASERRATYEAMGDAIVKLHQVNFRDAGLEDYGRVGG